MNVKTIGILTSGGDAPGMNAAIRAVVRASLQSGITVLGIKRGFNGLITDEIDKMDFKSVSDIMHRGGTILRTARSQEFMTEPGLLKAVRTAKNYSMEGIVIIGGDGSFKGARELYNKGINTIGIPGTIDNDIGCSDYTIGFDTACNTAVEAVDRLRDTSLSHNRISVVEVMGRNSGHLALNVGIATGAVLALVPERKFDIQHDVIEVVKQAEKSGKSHNIIIVSEGVEGGARRIADALKGFTDFDIRTTILGHIQRGGTPSVVDRVNATRMGVHAVTLLKEGIGNRLVCIKNDKLVDFDITEGLAMSKGLSEEFYFTSRVVSK